MTKKYYYIETSTDMKHGGYQFEIGRTDEKEISSYSKDSLHFCKNFEHKIDKEFLIKILGDAVIRGDKKRIRIVKEIRRIN